MALVPDQKFSTFDNGGDLIEGDIVVGLRDGINTRFTYVVPDGVSYLIGTANEVLVNGSVATPVTGGITLTLPQSIGTTSTPTFSGLALSSPLLPASGGTGVSSVTTIPTASAWAAWDANVNFSANNLIRGRATTITSGGTTVLTIGSAGTQEFTGTMTQTVEMPVASPSTDGISYTLINNSSGVVTATSSGGNTIVAMAANTTAFVTCILPTGTTAASWNASYLFDNGAGVISITGTANQVIASASTGNVVLSLPQSIATSSDVQFNSVRLSNSGIKDANNNTIIGLTATGSAVNYLNVQNSATGNGVQLQALGSDSNINFVCNAKGTGQFYGVSQNSTPFVLVSGTNSHITNFAFANTAQNRTVTFPDADGTLLMTGQAINTVPSINFGGSTLSDYVANGTFTPTITFATVGNLSMAYTTQTGIYSRIGNIITVTGTIAGTPTFTTSSGTFIISGIPINFGSNTVILSGFVAKGTIYTLSASYTSMGVVVRSSNQINLLQSGATASGTGALDLSASNFISGSAFSIQFSFSYLV